MLEELRVVAMCIQCTRGYVSVNWENPCPRCHACGGRITAIEPVPNRLPYVNGPFVRRSAPT
jgi:Zn finger protein HypA/HybF involved in hydrogenase expression